MLDVRDISVGYGEYDVLSAVSVEMRPGRIIGLLGANGAGKTTLIRTLNGTLAPRSGEITLDGRPLETMSRREVARNIAVVAQENETRFPVTVLEFVLAGRFVYGNNFGWETEKDVDLARAALSDCDLTFFGQRPMNSLSGGERQRVVLARALATGARVLLLDEPTANLDLAHQAMMLRLVRERCREQGASAVVITHDLNLAAEFADDVIMLKAGKIAAKGPPSEVLTNINIKNVFDVDALLDQNPSSGKVRVTAVY
ncbi:MAG TPA: ABC transporter ATP-binding protein [Pyrinomonadaceae bacterium]|nr:ABC transporter ATP-binding protein [Pyrinomonadaceae bacterium]